MSTASVTSLGNMNNHKAELLLRLCFAAVILTHGVPKLLGVPHGSINNPMQSSEHLIANVMGLPFAGEIAFLVMILETVGALLLSAGLFTRLVALAFSFQMAGICYALGPNWPWIDRGIEYPFFLLIVALFFVAKGGGKYSIDHVFSICHQQLRIT